MGQDQGLCTLACQNTPNHNNSERADNVRHRLNCSQISRGLLTSTGNFKSHYKLKHPALLSSLEKYLIGKPDETVKLQQSNLKNFISPAVDIDTVIILFSIDRLYIFTGELII